MLIGRLLECEYLTERYPAVIGQVFEIRPHEEGGYDYDFHTPDGDWDWLYATEIEGPWEYDEAPDEAVRDYVSRRMTE